MKRCVFAAMMVILAAGPAHAQPAGEPTFSVGDTWKRSNGQVIRVVRADENGFGFTGFLSDCRACVLHVDKKMTPLNITDADGKPPDFSRLRGVFVGPSYRFFDWPLEVGKSWKFSASALTSGQSQSVTVDTRVKSYEEIKTQAGVFKAYQMQRSWSMNWPTLPGSSWIVTEWYSPDVKAVVKSISTNPKARDWELVSYDLK